MNSSWSDGPFQRVEQRGRLVLGKTLSEHQGQSRMVCVLASHPGWIYKEYNSTPEEAAVAQLDALISFPERLSGGDRAIVDHNMSWPTARVVAETRTVGVLLPHAPDSFQTTMQLPGGARRMLPPIDILVQTDSALIRRGIPAQSIGNRVTVCSSVVATAALLERHGLVYLDWSYANAFWSPRDLSTYVIDVDSCSFGPRQMIGCPGWDDPLVQQGSMGGNPVDRYRVALLAGRCLTAEREASAVPGALRRLAATQPPLDTVSRLVADTLSADRPENRPPIAALASALQQAAAALAGTVTMAGANRGSANVSGWAPIGSRRLPQAPVRPVPPDPVPVPAQRPPSESPPPWVNPVPVAPSSGPPSSGGGVAALVLLGIVAAVIFILVIKNF